jgi:prophage antirepressor-like protein
MNELQIFNNSNFGTIRSIIIENEPWFVGKDVAECLGYTNTRKALIDHVDIEDKKDGVTIRDSIGRLQTPTLINESGVYSLVFSSKLQSAKDFKHWVTSEVLPSIRKHGAYMTEEVIQKALTSPDFLIQLATQLKESQEKAEKLQIEVEQQSHQIAKQNITIAHMQPKAEYCDRVLRCKEAVPTSLIAKDYGWSAIKLNRYLQQKHIQYRQGNHWLLYRKYDHYGYTVTNTHVTTDRLGVQHSEEWTYWTQRGRMFLYNLLKADGILPILEQPMIPMQEVPEYQPPTKKGSD